MASGADCSVTSPSGISRRRASLMSRRTAGRQSFFTSDAAEADAAAFLAQHDLGRDRPLVALAPGAAHFTKRWPPQHWIALARQLEHDARHRGRRRDHRARRCRRNRRRGRRPRRQCSRSILAATERRSCSGARSRSSPVIPGCYTSRPPWEHRWSGFTVRRSRRSDSFRIAATAIAVQHQLGCRPCSSQGGPVCPLGHHHCLVKLMPEEVMAAVASISPKPKAQSPKANADDS